jgi:DNA-binding NarL/FixJ family response regulator
VKSQAQKIHVLLIDDRPVFREGLGLFLKNSSTFKVVGEIANSGKLLDIVMLLKPAVALAGLCHSFKQDFPPLRQLARQIPVILLVSDINGQDVDRAFAAGVKGMVTQSASLEAVSDAVRIVSEGGRFIRYESATDVSLGARATDLPPLGDNRFQLTSREIGVLKAVVAGKSSVKIARQLSISEHTVKHHITSIFDKMGVSSRLELVLSAIHHRIAASDGK